MVNDSILSFEFSSRVLSVAKKNLMRDSFLQPVAFLQAVSGKRHILKLDLSKGDNHRVLIALGRSIKAQGIEIAEASMVFESFFVEVQSAPGALRVPPSCHPMRREAINLFGRDAERKKVTSVIVPFRKVGGQIIFESPSYEEYATTGGGVSFLGLVDDLFVGNMGL